MKKHDRNDDMDDRDNERDYWIFLLFFFFYYTKIKIQTNGTIHKTYWKLTIQLLIVIIDFTPKDKVNEMKKLIMDKIIYSYFMRIWQTK